MNPELATQSFDSFKHQLHVVCGHRFSDSSALSKSEILCAGIVPVRPKVHFTSVTAGPKDEGEKADTLGTEKITRVTVFAIHH